MAILLLPYGVLHLLVDSPSRYFQGWVAIVCVLVPLGDSCPLTRFLQRLGILPTTCDEVQARVVEEAKKATES